MQHIPLTKNQILTFVAEDGIDKTTTSIPSLQNKNCSFKFISKEKQGFVLCGSEILSLVMSAISNKNFTINNLKKDGDLVANGDIILEGEANASDFLLAERTTLNLMQQLSAVSTNAYKMVEALSSSKIKILDTRKTVPGLRNLQKYAVRCGGGFNHRFGLDDLIMIKDNHIKASGGVANAIKSVIANNKGNLKIEVECETEAEVREAIKHKIHFIMLDNMNFEEMQKASQIIRTTDIKIEVSGGVNLQNIANFRGLDIDFISSGSLTHSFNSIDISAKIMI